MLRYFKSLQKSNLENNSKNVPFCNLTELMAERPVSIKMGIVLWIVLAGIALYIEAIYGIVYLSSAETHITSMPLLFISLSWAYPILVLLLLYPLYKGRYLARIFCYNIPIFFGAINSCLFLVISARPWLYKLFTLMFIVLILLALYHCFGNKSARQWYKDCFWLRWSVKA